VSSFVPGSAYLPVGPWWFFAFIGQMYLIFPLIFYLQKRFGNVFLLGLFLVGVLVNFGLYYFLLRYRINLLYSVFGHLPEICLGVYLARTPRRSFSIWLILVAAIVFCSGNIFMFVWPLAAISLLVLFLSVMQKFMPLLLSNELLKGALIYLGASTLSIFLVHGFLRCPFTDYARNYDHWLATIVLALGFLLVLFALYQALHSLMPIST